MFRGITVALTVRTQTGEDPFHAPIWEKATQDVENVLVAPATAEEILDTLNLYGKRAVYNLYIPKGDGHDWEDTEVKFFGKTFRTIGPVTEYVQGLVPGAWNRRVQVEAIE